MTRVLAIDPGSEQSGVVAYVDGRVVVADVIANDTLRSGLKSGEWLLDVDVLACEMMQARGMPFSNEEMQTLVWLGRFIEAWGREHELVYRKDVKMHLCGSMRAKDANIRQALLDRFGGKAKAVGKKATPGPLYGVKSHCWAALSVAVYYADKVSV